MGVAVRAVAVGVLAGVVYGLLRGDPMAGVVTGVVYAAGFAIASPFLRRSGAMAGLTFQQRRLVLRRLRDGAAVDDPRLAAALAEHARMLLATPVTPKVAGIGAAVFVVAGVVIGVVGQATYGLFVGAMLVVFAGLLVVPAWRVSGRRRELILRSLRATEQNL